MLMKTGILYFTTCFHGFGILRHVDPFVRMLHICYALKNNNIIQFISDESSTELVIYLYEYIKSISPSTLFLV